MKKSLDFAKIRNEVLYDMEKYPEHVTLDDIKHWLIGNIGTKGVKGHSTYHVKHLIERDYGQERGQKMCYCANNWVKYVVVEMGIRVRKYMRVDGGVKYFPQPTQENVLDNSVNYFFA